MLKDALPMLGYLSKYALSVMNKKNKNILIVKVKIVKVTEKLRHLMNIAILVINIIKKIIKLIIN